MKILGNYGFYRGVIEGGESFKAKPYFQGGWGKYRKINSFRIIEQDKYLKSLSFKIFKL